MVCIKPSDPPSKTACRLSQSFFHNIRSLLTDRPTDRRTDRPTERTRNSAGNNRLARHTDILARILALKMVPWNLNLNGLSCQLLLFHRCTRASYVYNGCLAWYNVVLTPRIHSSAKYSQLGQTDNSCDVSDQPTRTL